MAIHKRAFYPDPEVEVVLLKAPPKKMSERVNQLILKGLQKEKEEAMAIEYSRYGEAISKQDHPKKTKKNKNNLMTTDLSYRLFVDDDSSNEDLI